MRQARPTFVRVLALLVPVLVLAAGAASAQSGAAPASAEAPLVPEWVLRGAPVHVTLNPAPLATPGLSDGPRRLKGTLLSAGPDSLWLQEAAGVVPLGLGRADLQRVEVSLERHPATKRGAGLGLCAGFLLGELGTAVIGEAETDGVLPFWGSLVGTFLGAIVGRIITVESWETTWEGGPGS